MLCAYCIHTILLHKSRHNLEAHIPDSGPVIDDSHAVHPGRGALKFEEHHIFESQTTFYVLITCTYRLDDVVGLCGGVELGQVGLVGGLQVELVPGPDVPAGGPVAAVEHRAHHDPEVTLDVIPA